MTLEEQEIIWKERREWVCGVFAGVRGGGLCVRTWGQPGQQETQYWWGLPCLWAAAASRDPEQASRQACVEQSRVQPSQHGCSYSVFGASTLPHPWMALCTGGQGEAKARTGMRTRWSLPTYSIPLPGRWVSFPRSPCGSKHMLWPSGALKPTSLETSFTQKCLINTLPPS